MEHADEVRSLPLLDDGRGSYTSKEVADALGISVRSLWQYLEAGVIPAFRLSSRGNYRMLRSTVIDLINGKYNDAEIPEARGWMSQRKKLEYAVPVTSEEESNG